ncbi:MAG: NAD-dependent epimerase [Chitinophagales bacterium]|nr:NAD-dependent epimerase [Chitinophagales bacterium]
MNKKILITGTAGFIGFHLANRLAKEGFEVIGLDSINNYYDVTLKIARLEAAGFHKRQIAYKERITSQTLPNLHFIQLKLEDMSALNKLFLDEQFDVVINLAAQAGVRYSLKNPSAYIQSNIVGFTNLLECCRHYNIQHLVYASSSSVYGLNKKIPFSTKDAVNHPVSLYAASKKSNELLAHTYSHLFGIPTTGLRFFTVYGPWGRPDMAYFLFTEAILKNDPIKVFNHGRMSRDFTYIDDIVEGIFRVMQQPPKSNTKWVAESPEADSSSAPYRIYNIGKNAPVSLLGFIETIEKALSKEAQKEFLPMQSGDVEQTYADSSALIKDTGYKPDTPLEKGIGTFVEWYKEYYKV